MMKIFFIFFENLLCFPSVKFFLSLCFPNSSIRCTEQLRSIDPLATRPPPKHITGHIPEPYQTHIKTLLDTHQNITRHAPEYNQTHTRTLLDTHQNITRLSPEHYQTHARTLLDTHHNIIRHTPEHYQTHTRT